MKVVVYNSDKENPEILNSIMEFCAEAEKEKGKSASGNMKFTDWENSPESLIYILQKTNRFDSDNGMFSCLYDNDNLVAISGCYRADFDRNVIIGGVRAWVIPQYRAKYVQANYLLKAQKDWAISVNANAFALTFNDYNLKLMEILIRDGKYKEKAVRGVGHTRPNFYEDFEKLPYMIPIKNTMQWVIYQKFNDKKILWPK